MDPSGAHRDVEIAPITADEDLAWHGGDPLTLPRGEVLWLHDTATPLWFSMLDDSRTLFVQYNAVVPGTDAVADQILARVKKGGVDRVVVDLRNNGRGDNTTYQHLLTVLRDPAIDRPGQFTVLIGRETFSAAANFATALEATTHASFAGEAMGGSPNGYGDALELSLPYGGLSYSVATRYWQMSTPDDPRITIEPDLAIPFSSEDYLQGVDPVLDLVVAGTPVGDVRGAILGS